MAHDWLEEYAVHASSTKRSGTELGTLRAEYVHRYNRLLDRENNHILISSLICLWTLKKS